MANQYTCNIYSTIEINQIVSLYLGGTSFSEIGLLLKRKKKKINDILINEGVWVEGRDIKRKYFTENEVKEIINQYVNDGCGLREISRNFNVSISPIKRILIENNVLRKGYSNGKKIDLSDDQKDEIKRLYLVENKNSSEIGNILNLEFIPWEENIKKRTNCSISENELKSIT